jgi:uncharacterized protein YjbI with pentapeptide repeats
MSSEIDRPIPGNIPDGIIRNQHLDLSKLTQRIVANEFFECDLTGEASDLYGELGPNLISCKLNEVVFPSGVSHFDAKDSIFVNSQVRGKFNRIMVTQCAFRNVLFASATFRDTALIDSIFEGVEFYECDFSVASFKNDSFRNCKFLRCKASNKLFEHCLFYHCTFISINLQEGSILQNYGIHLSDTVDLSIYRAETGEPLTVAELTPQNRFERISLAYFQGSDLNESPDLFEVVKLKPGDATRTNILYVISGIKQLATFILFLYDEGRLVLFFPLQLYWSIDHFLQSYRGNELPLHVVEALEISSAKLRRVYEDVCLSIPASKGHDLLISEEYSKKDLEEIIRDLQVNVSVGEFTVFNSPSLAQVVSADNFELLLFIAVVLSTRFRAEVDHYHADRKLLDIGTRLLSDGKSNQAAAYQALVVLNVPSLLYVRISARVSLSLLGRIQRMVLGFLEEKLPLRRRDPLPKAITILFLAANPPETVRLQVDREASEIDKALRASGVRDRFRIEHIWAASEPDLQDSLLRFRPEIVHLSAHGIRSGKPLLEEWPRDTSSKVSNKLTIAEEEVQGIAQLFGIAGEDLRCVIINACHSARLAQALTPHVDCVIGMWDTVGDDIAIRFSWSFYNSLGYGRSISDAFDLAVAQVAIAGRQQSQVPGLFPGRKDPRSVVLIQHEAKQK